MDSGGNELPGDVEEGLKANNINGHVTARLEPLNENQPR